MLHRVMRQQFQSQKYYPIAQAQADGDRVYAVIVGSGGGVNNIRFIFLPILNILFFTFKALVSFL